MTRKVAFVTGASRGIGKTCAVYLAKSGYDVAVSARTVQDGEGREHSPTVHQSDVTPLPGSLASTAALVEAEGQDALLVPADLLDRASLEAAVATVLDKWGRIDVLVNNGRYMGPGHMDLLVDTPMELLDKHMEANVMAPILLIKLVIPGMRERGDGLIINMTAATAYCDNLSLPGEGGWGLGYSISKGAFHRVAGSLAPELKMYGIRCVNIEPGLIATERIGIDMDGYGFSNGAPVGVVGVVVEWLLNDPAAADEYHGRTLEAQFFCKERDLLPGWAGPQRSAGNVRYDRSGAELERLNATL